MSITSSNARHHLARIAMHAKALSLLVTEWFGLRRRADEATPFDVFLTPEATAINSHGVVTVNAKSGGSTQAYYYDGSLHSITVAGALSPGIHVVQPTSASNGGRAS